MNRWLCAVLLLVACAAQAQSYPSKPIRIVIPFPPGNTTDIMSRLIAPKMSERLGQQAIVENQPGAGVRLCVGLVAMAVLDGFIIMWVHGCNLVVLLDTSRTIPFAPARDFGP